MKGAWNSSQCDAKCLLGSCAFIPTVHSSGHCSSEIQRIFSASILVSTKKEEDGVEEEKEEKGKEIKVENPFPGEIIDNSLKLTHVVNSEYLKEAAIKLPLPCLVLQNFTC